MLEVASGVLVRQSTFWSSNAVVVTGPSGALVVDPGIGDDDLEELADELADRGLGVVAGFATHPHWDHLLWHRRLGDPPRFATRACVEHAAAHLTDAREKAHRAAAGGLDLVGQVRPLPGDGRTVPWDGPEVRVLEHRAHAPGHAALFLPDTGLLIGGDMLSDVEIPLLDVRWSDDPVGDYAAALDLFEALQDRCRVVVPGHGGVGGAGALAVRVAHDRAYLAALAAGGGDDDPRLDPRSDHDPDWLLAEHRSQRDRLSAVVGRRPTSVTPAEDDPQG